MFINLASLALAARGGEPLGEQQTALRMTHALKTLGGSGLKDDVDGARLADVCQRPNDRLADAHVRVGGGRFEKVDALAVAQDAQVLDDRQPRLAPRRSERRTKLEGRQLAADVRQRSGRAVT